ncbi:hypothetical protein HHI36_012738, partial [Cryptolaemus montrouzieri]
TIREVATPGLIISDQFMALMTKLDVIILVISDIKIIHEFLKAEVDGCRSILENDSCTNAEFSDTLKILKA